MHERASTANHVVGGAGKLAIEAATERAVSSVMVAATSDGDTAASQEACICCNEAVIVLLNVLRSSDLGAGCAKNSCCRKASTTESHGEPMLLNLPSRSKRSPEMLNM